MQLRTSQESEINYECGDFDDFCHQSHEIYLINYAQPLLCIGNEFGIIGIYHTRCSSGYTYTKCAAIVPYNNPYILPKEGRSLQEVWLDHIVYDIFTYECFSLKCLTYLKTL